MKKMLLIEDDQATAQTYVEAFSKKYTVEVVPEVQRGLTRAIDTVPDIILLDIMLPGGKNGFDFLQDLKNHTKIAQIPVLVLTNLDDQRQTALDAGARECLVKANVEISEIEAVVEKLLQK